MPHSNIARKELQSILNKTTRSHTGECEKGIFVASEFGGRILGLYPNPDGANALWVNPDLADTITAKSWKMGGERLWLSPERDYSYLKPQTFEEFFIQPEYDPGNFEKTGETFENHFSLKNYITGETYTGCTGKRTITPLTDPYNTGLAYAGAQINEEYTIGQAGLAICCWSLSQLYIHGANNPATALFPVKTGVRPLHYFSPIPADRIATNEGYICFRLDSNHICKLAIRPEDTVTDNRCKALLIGPTPDTKTWYLAAKCTDNLPLSQADCVDPAKSDPQGEKGCVQSYNHGPEGVAKELYFGEIELQFAKGKTVGAQTVANGSHDLIAYCGSKGEMVELAGHLLNNKSVLKIY